MKVLICGGRGDGLGIVGTALVVGLAAFRPPLTVVHGDARGVDRMAGALARSLGLDVEAFPADWRGLGRIAGPVRNGRMLREAKPDLVLAFKPSFDWSYRTGGTEHMVSLARAADVPAYVVQQVPALVGADHD